MLGGRALLAFQRGEDTREALLGALMTAEHQAFMLSWGKAWVEWVQAWAKLQKRRRRR